MKMLLLCLTLFCGQAFANDVASNADNDERVEYVRPQTAQEFKSATVMITNKGKYSGGSGVIYKSTENASYVLTNSHVCELLEEGGLVVTESGDYNVEQYKQSKVHDICVVRIIQNLGINTKLASASPAFGDDVIISGHPHLLPTTISRGHMSGYLDIQLLAGVEKCTEKEQEEMGFLCYWFDGMPLIKTFTAMTSSALASPGNSGSGVFNSEGEIIGLLFAGIGRGISQSFIVPLSHIKAFMRESKKLKWKEANSAVRYSEYRSRRSVKRKGTPFKLTLKNLSTLYFPAIKDPKTDSLSEKLQTCKRGLGKCQNYVQQ